MNEKANNFMNKLEEKFMGPLGSFSQTKFVRAIMNTGWQQFLYYSGFNVFSIKCFAHDFSCFRRFF